MIVMNVWKYFCEILMSRAQLYVRDNNYKTSSVPLQYFNIELLSDRKKNRSTKLAFLHLLHHRVCIDTTGTRSHGKYCLQKKNEARIYFPFIFFIYKTRPDTRPSRVRLGWGCVWAGAVRPKTAKTQKK